MRSFPGLLLLSILLTGCASLTEEECAVGDWETIGSQDAKQGHKSTRMADHQKACKRHNILPDQTLYLKGYRQGLVSYCTPSNGFSVGRNGYRYNGICPAQTEPEFLRGYQRGETLHAVETTIAEARSSLKDVQQQIGEARAASSEKKNRVELFRLFTEENRLERELSRLRRERDRSLLEADAFLQAINPDV